MHFNKSKNGVGENDFVLLEVQVPKDTLIKPPKNCSELQLSHTLDITSDGSHGKTDSTWHKEIPIQIAVKKIKPKNIIPIKEINTFTVTNYGGI